MLALNVPVAAVVTPGAPGSGWRELAAPEPLSSEIPLQRSFVMGGLMESAWTRGIPVFSAGTHNGRPDREIDTSVKAQNPSLIVVACWPARLPGWLLEIPEHGGINIHPSRLPNFRGPVPLFWQRRAGLDEGAVTIHEMSARIDEGAVYGRTEILFPDGAAMEELDGIAGGAGGEAAATVVTAIAAGLARPVPQPPGGSYQSYPRAEDFSLSTSWSARHAWNFMRAAESFGVPFTIRAGERTIVAHRAVAFRPGSRYREPVLDTPDGLAVQFTSGVVMVR
jgi:methionyl-tRNA formyltransferase